MVSRAITPESCGEPASRVGASADGAGRSSRDDDSMLKTDVTPARLRAARYLTEWRAPILGAAELALSRRAGRYAGAGEASRVRLETLYDLVADALAQGDAANVIAHANRVANERFRAGYDLAQVQSAFDALEEAVWADVTRRLPPEAHAPVLRAVSSVVGGTKDQVARVYVTLAARAHAPAVDVDFLARGVEAT